MRVVDVDVRESGRGTRIGATVVWERNKRTPDELEFVYRDTPANAVVTAGDALAATVFMPAMAAGEDVAIEAPVSKRLYDGLGRLANVWLPLMPKWRPVDVSAELVDRSDLSPTVVAACFSAGVDSFYTVMRPRDEPITTLLTLRGFTASTQILARGDADLLIVAEAVRRMGFDHLVADTNAIPFCEKYIGVHREYARVFSGAALAAVALGLGSRIRRCLVAAGHPYGLEIPTGIDPNIEHWSSEAVDIVFDGHGVERAEKVRFIGHNEIVLDSLAVCPQVRPPGAELNCRRCDKCQEAGLLLLLEGTLHRCRTLGPVTAETLRRTIVRPLRTAAFEHYRSTIGDPELRAAITTALRRSRMRRLARPLGLLLRRLGLR